MLMAARWGAVLGALLAPTTLWTILRHAPLGRVVLVTFGGTVAGALAGVLVAVPHIGAALGFLAALAWLRRRYPRARVAGSPRDGV